MNLNILKKALDTEINKLKGEVGLKVDFLKSDEHFLYNEDKQFWAASIIKIPIACAVYKKIEKGELDKEKRHVIKEGNRVDGSGISKLFDEQTLFTIHDLVVMTLTISDNSAANQLVDIVGREYIVEYIEEIGLKNTTFKHKMMIKAGKGPNLTTPADAGMLLSMLYDNEIPGSEEILNIMKHTSLRDRIPELLPSAVEISHKPGSLPKAMHEVGIVHSDNPFIFSFFSDDQEDKKLTKEVLSQSAKLCFDYSTNS